MTSTACAAVYHVPEIFPAPPGRTRPETVNASGNEKPRMKPLLIYTSDALAGQFAASAPRAFERHRLAARVLALSPGRAHEAELRGALAGGPGRVAAALALLPLAAPGLAALNRACSAERVPLVAVLPLKGGVQIGPGVRYGETACVACFKEQVSYLQSHDLLGPGQETEDWSACAPPHFHERLTEEALRFIDRAPASALAGGYVLRFDRGGRERRYRLLKSPLCTVCSDFARHPTESITAD
jgi:hypothetical protein